MTATIHKLSAGSGYEYYIRQTAAHDASERGSYSLADYYAAKGESPGYWIGSGLAAFDTISAGDAVTENQMKALFGLGRHPDTEAIEARIRSEEIAKGAKAKDALRAAEKASRLGNPYRIYEEATVFRQRCAKEFTAYNLARGMHWNAAIPEQERADIRTRIAREMFRDEYQRDPLDDRELSGWVARSSRSATTAVAGFDITYSPVKSVSALWAIAPLEVSNKIEQAHRAAVADALEFLEKYAAYTRLGTNGVAQVDVVGLIATAFEHRDSRAGDPDLHTHVVIANKVLTLDGLWRSLDGRMVFRAMVAASEVYNTRLELHLYDLLGLEFIERDDEDPEKRPIREIAGLDLNLCEFWSSRDTEIVARLGELAREFQDREGREPTTAEMLQLSEQATLDTRPAKHQHRSRAEQRAQWREEALELVGGVHGVASMVWAVMHPARIRRAEVTDEWIAETADRVIEAVSHKRAVWQWNHVRAEAERQVKPVVSKDQWAAATKAVVDQALAASRSVGRRQPDAFEEPEQLKRLDGSGVLTVAQSQQYTSATVIAAEHRLLATALRDGAGALSEATVDIALLEYAANNSGRTLNAGQAEMVRRFATSGHRFSIGIAPAGAGKTTAMAVLARAWMSSGGNVIGLAPRARAAAILGEEIGCGITATTIDQLTWVLKHLTPETVDIVPVPRWVHEIGPRTLVIIDEIATASTLNLDLAIDFLVRRGAVIRGIGDDRQLASPEAGGIVRDIVATAGAVTLVNVVRFTNQSEAAASLAIREGDPAGIAFYTDNQRVHVGALEKVIDACYTAWAADTAASCDSVMLAATHAVVNTLNLRARRDRLSSTDTAGGSEIRLSDGLYASVGDIVCTRHNDTRLRFSGTDYVRNGYRWRVLSVNPDGSVTAAHLGSGRHVDLPAAYVTAHLTLGYAATIDSSQGITTGSRTIRGTCHSVLTGTETREQLYVAITRARDRNDIYVQTANDFSHAVHSERALRPPTGVDILTEILGNDSGQKSATTLQREAFDPFVRLGHAVDSFVFAVGKAAEHRAGPEVMARIDEAAERLRPGLSGEPAWPVLRQHLAIIAIQPDEAGQSRDPVTELDEAIKERDFHNVRDEAAVLDWRLDNSGRHSCGDGPLPWLSGIPDVLKNDVMFGLYLLARQQLVADLSVEVGRAPISWTPAMTPMWARPFVAHRQLAGDLAVWRAARHIDDGERRPSGPKLPEFGDARRYQDDLDVRVETALHSLDHASGKWLATAYGIEPRMLKDPYWPVLADRIDLAHHAGVDIDDLLRQAAEAGPLPDEQPAAALWWRIAHELDPGVLESSDRDPLRPKWLADVEPALGPNVTALVVNDPAWPKLVAAIDAADPRRWRPADLLATANQLLTDACDAGEGPRPDQYATALAWRITAIVNFHTRVFLDDHSAGPPVEPPRPEDDEAAAIQAGQPLYVNGSEGTSASGFDETHSHNLAHIPDVSDPDYLASLETLGPPDQPLSADWIDWDEEERDDEWHPPVDPTTIPEHLDLPPLQRLAVLRSELAEYNRIHGQLLAERRHVREADSIIMDLRRRADTQRPYLLAAQDASADWMEAEQRATEDRERLELLRLNVRRSDDNTDVDLDELESLLAGVIDANARAELAQQLAEMRNRPRITSDIAELRFAEWLAQLSNDAAKRAKTAADQAQQALVDIAGPRGIVTETDVQSARLLADDLDQLEIKQSRYRRERKGYQIWRTEAALGIQHLSAAEMANLGTAETHAAEPVCESAPHNNGPVPPQALDGLKALTTEELAHSIRDLQTQLASLNAANSVLFRWAQLDATSVGEATHQRRLADEAERRRQQLAAAQQEQRRRQQLGPEQLAAEQEQRDQESHAQQDTTSAAAPETAAYETAMEPDGAEL